METPVFPNEGGLAMATAWKAASGLLDDAVVDLFMNDITPTKESVAADFEDPTYTTYAPVTLTDADWLNPYVNQQDQVQISAATVARFTVTTPADPPEVAYGYRITTAAGKVLLAQRFDTPQPLGTAGDVVEIAIRLSQPFELGGLLVEA